MRFANQLHLARCCGGLLVNVKACASAEELGPLDFLLTSPIYLLQLEEDGPAKVSESPTSSQQSEPQLGLAQATHESIFALHHMCKSCIVTCLGVGTTMYNLVRAAALSRQQNISAGVNHQVRKPILHDEAPPSLSCSVWYCSARPRLQKLMPA